MPAPSHRGEPDTVTVRRVLPRGVTFAPRDVATRAHMTEQRAAHALRHLAERGELERVAPGVYRAAHGGPRA